jgi:type IV secretory pathway VirJ component
MKILRLATTLGMIAALAACNSTDSTLGIEGANGQQAAVPATPGVATPATPGTPQTAAVAGTIRMRFAPIIGAPVEKVTSLSRRISARAKEQNVAIVASTDMTATHVIKGYFSVLGEGSNTTVIYVFDILDPSGNRLHRIQGQVSVTGSNAADPWAAVPGTTLEAIADKAMAEFAVWQRGGQA